MLIPQELQLSPKMCSLTRERYGIMAFPYLVSFRGNLKIGLT
mgnify:FL=1